MTAPQQQASLFRMASFRLAVLGMLFSLIAAVVVFALIYEATGIAAREELAPIVAGDRADLRAGLVYLNSFTLLYKCFSALVKLPPVLASAC